MKWTGLLKRFGYQLPAAGAQPDPFMALAQQSEGQKSVNVNCNVGTSLEYGEVKCGFSVTVTCPQNEQSMNMAGELAFRKAIELTNDAATHLGLPLLPAIPEDA